MLMDILAMDTAILMGGDPCLWNEGVVKDKSLRNRKSEKT